MTVEVGTIIAGRYRLDRKLGEGGMGAVWAATHTVTGKAVAVKFLRDELAAKVDLVERFLREARAACAVRHPNVVQIHDVLTLESGAPAMVMDLLDGESLGARLAREGRLAVPETMRLMSPVLAAVSAAHAASIVHRDLKPENLFLARTVDGAVEVKVLDFGIAKISTTDQASGQLTKTGSMLGTPFYMSPEQLFGEKDLDARSDIWALGIIFYECLSGVLPTHAENLGQIIKTVTTTGIAPLSSIAPHVPSEIALLVDRMLSRDRSARPSSADEVRAVVAKYTGVTSHPSVPIAVASGSAAAMHPTSSATEVAAAAGPRTGDLQWSSTGSGAKSRPKPIATGVLAGVAVAAFLSVAAGAVLVVPRLLGRAPPSIAAPSADGPSSAPPMPTTSPPVESAALAPRPAAPGEPSASAAPSATVSPPRSSAKPAGPRVAPVATVSASTPKAAPSPAPSPTGGLEQKVPF